MVTEHFSPLPPSVDELIPGSFFMRRIEGWTGRWIAVGQALIRGGSNFTHAGIVLDGEQIIEAEPGGARIKPAQSLWEHAGPVMVSDAPMQRWLEAQVFPRLLGAEYEAEMRKRAEIVGKARYLNGIGYSFLDYLALAMAEAKIPGWQLVRDRVESSQHLMCSALVDRAYAWAEVHLFDDGRLPGDVTPWDLEQYVWQQRADHMRRLVEEAQE
jgi:hypothetical protein